MAKLTLAILDGDARYMENLAAYVTGHYRHRFNLLTFAEPVMLIDYFQQKGAAADILLVAIEKYGDWLMKIETSIVIFLTGGGSSHAAPVGNASSFGGAPSGSVLLSGDTARSGNVPLSGGVARSGNIPLSGDTARSGSVPLSGDVAPSGSVPLSGGVMPSGNVPLSGGVMPSGNVPLSGGVMPSGDATLSGAVLSPGAEPSGAARPDSELSVMRNAADRAPKGFERVDRYRGADSLIADILRIYASGDLTLADTDSMNGGRENKITAIFSAEGGSGRTSLAIALCSYFSRQGLRTLYLNFDFFGVEYFAFGADRSSDGLSDIIYTAKTRPERLTLKFEALAKPAPGYGFSYFTPPLYPMDIDEILPSDLEVIISKSRGAGLYDRIVIDTHSGLSLRNKALMELADSVLIIANGSVMGQKKLLKFKEQIDASFGNNTADFYRRFHIILNRVPCEAAYTADTSEIAEVFRAKVTVIQFSDDIRDEYAPEALTDISHGFGAAAAEIARRYQTARAADVFV